MPNQTFKTEEYQNNLLIDHWLPESRCCPIVLVDQHFTSSLNSRYLWGNQGLPYSLWVSQAHFLHALRGEDSCDPSDDTLQHAVIGATSYWKEWWEVMFCLPEVKVKSLLITLSDDHNSFTYNVSSPSKISPALMSRCPCLCGVYWCKHTTSMPTSKWVMSVGVAS